MQSKATTVDQYIDELPEDRKKAITELRKVIKKNIPQGFQGNNGLWQCRLCSAAQQVSRRLSL